MRSLAQHYEAKIDASKTYAVLRITADFDTCGEVFKSILHLLENIHINEISLPLDEFSVGQGTKHEEMSIRSLLDQVAKVTSTVIRPLFNVREVNASKEKVISPLTFYSCAEVDLVTCISSWPRRRRLGGCTEGAIANTTADSSKNLVCILDWWRKISKRSTNSDRDRERIAFSQKRKAVGEVELWYQANTPLSYGIGEIETSR